MRASKITLVVQAVGVGVLAFAGATAEAQTITTAETGRRHADTPGLLSSPARLMVREVPLPLALARLSETSGVPIAYSSSVLARETGGVSCACEAISVAAALELLLAGTAYDYAELVGQVVVFAVPQAAPGNAARALEELLRGVPVAPLRLAKYTSAAPTGLARLPPAQQGQIGRAHV